MTSHSTRSGRCSRALDLAAKLKFDRKRSIFTSGAVRLRAVMLRRRWDQHV
jgi:hypothetical protein